MSPRPGRVARIMEFAGRVNDRMDAVFASRVAELTEAVGQLHIAPAHHSTGQA
jgi:hypothetical protein